MKLYLVRHAIAEDKSAGKKDADRALTKEGRDKMEQISAGLRAMAVEVELIASSPLRRARETAEILGAVLGGVRIELVPEIADGDPRAALRALRAFRELRSLAAVGHQPDLGHLASLLLTNDADVAWLPFKKGGAACFEADLGASAARAQLEWLVPPTWLRALAKTR